MKKKFLPFILSGVLALAGCIQQQGFDYKELNKELNGLTMPIDRKNTKITMLTESTNTNLNDTMFMNRLREITGLNIELISVNLANIKPKLQSMIASKQLPDISQCFLDDFDIYELAKNNTLVPIDEYLDIMPNFKKLYADTPENTRMFTEYQQYDGHLYQIKAYGYARKINHCFMYRKDIFEKNGIKPWTNTEEFYQNLKQLKEIYPASYPMSAKLQMELTNYLGAQWGLRDTNFYYNWDTLKWQYGKTSEPMRDMMNFLRKLYQEQLLDKNFLTNTPSDWTAQMTTEESSFVTLDWVDRMDMFNDDMQKSNPEYEMTVGYPIGPERRYRSMDRINSSYSYLVSNNKNKELSLKLMDFLISEKGAELATLGVEGESFRFRDDMSVEYLGFDSKAELNIKNLEKKYGLFIAGTTIRFDPRCAYFQYTPKTEEAQKFVVENDLLLPNYYRTRVPPENLEEFNQIQSDLNKEFSKIFVCYVVSGENPETVWTEWLRKAQSLHVDTYEQILNDKVSIPVPCT